MKIIYTDVNGVTEIETKTMRETVKEIIEITKWMKEETDDEDDKKVWEEFRDELLLADEEWHIEKIVDAFINAHWEGSVSIELA